MYLKLKHTPSL